jgi:hypothetical protein
MPLEFGHSVGPRRDGEGNPEGIVSLSPGLRAERYPGCTRARAIYPEGVLSPALAYDSLGGLIAVKWTSDIGRGDDATLSGLGVRLGDLPRVARRAQPWAERYNPFGIGIPDPGLRNTIMIPRDASLPAGRMSKLQGQAGKPTLHGCSPALLVLVLATLELCSLSAATRNDGALWRPRLATPALVAFDSPANRQFTAEFNASPGAKDWSVTISNDLSSWTCQVLSATYSTINRGTQPGWRILASIPTNAPPELFTLVVSSSESVSVQSQSLSVVPAFATDFYILHMADEQIVQEFHNSPSGQWYNGVCTAEEFNWEKEPINLINPRFVMATGDHIDFNGCLDAYNNWGNWGTLYGTNYSYRPSGKRYFTAEETSAIEAKLADLYFQYHVFRVPYVECPGNHDVPPTSKSLQAPSPLEIAWHSRGAALYESYWGQRSWSFRMGDFYVLMHDWTERSLKDWAAGDYAAALSDPAVKYCLVGQHFTNDQAFMPATCDLMLVGHGHGTAALRSSPYYIYENGPSFRYGTCGFFNFTRVQEGWACDQTTSARNTAKDVWPLYTTNGVIRKVRSNRPDAMSITERSVTITNDLPQSFYDGRVRFILDKGNYNSITNGTILCQYDCYHGSKTAVLVRVNIPASGTVTVTMGTAIVPPKRG